VHPLWKALGADPLPAGHRRVVREADGDTPDWYVVASHGAFDSIESISPSAEGGDLANKIIEKIRLSH
jgi:hypothetical protein